MAIEFKLPELGENIAGGDVTHVMVKVGDHVKEEQAVMEIETGKATVEVPSSVAGVVTAIHVKEGGKAKVGQVILTIEPSGEAAPAPAPKTSSAPPPAPIAAPEKGVAQDTPKPRPAPAASLPPPVVKESGRMAVPASPSTRQFAREVGLDVADVPGSGPGGRISMDDVKAHARVVNTGLAGGSGRPAPVALPDLSKWGAVERQPLTAMRQAAAEHLSNCWTTIPHVTLHDKADITDIEKVRQENKGKAEAAGGKLTLTAFLIKIAASALKAHPKFNASIDVANNEMVLRKYVHIGVAMDTEKGLIVPVIRDADTKNIFKIATELAQLSDKARAGKVSIAEMQGGCFSVTNLGGIGCGFFTPIVNYPEAAILGVGKAVMEPVMVNGFFQPRLMMPLSLSFDHRIVDGADGARFLQWVIQAIQKPVLLSLEG